MFRAYYDSTESYDVMTRVFINLYSRVGGSKGSAVCVRVDWGGCRGSVAVNTAQWAMMSYNVSKVIY